MVNRSQTSIFGVSTIQQYLDLCERAVAQLHQSPEDVLRGYTAILAINHIPDWLQYKLSERQRSDLHLKSILVGTELKDDFESENDDLTLIRQIANGFKHLRAVHSTHKIEGFGMGPYGIGPFGRPYLLIDKGEELDLTARWDVASSLAQRTMEWWLTRLSAIR